MIDFMIVIIFVLFYLVLYIVVQYNSFKKKKIKIEQARKGIDIYLKQRFDLIPNLVETIKGQKDYEQTVLESLTNLRTNVIKNVDMQQKANLNSQYNNIILLVENYPELKTNEAFLNLQKKLTKMENQLQAARRIYNIEVTEYNTKVVTVPSNIIARMFGFSEEKLFSVSEDVSNLDIDFDNKT